MRKTTEERSQREDSSPGKCDCRQLEGLDHGDRTRMGSVTARRYRRFLKSAYHMGHGLRDLHDRDPAEPHALHVPTVDRRFDPRPCPPSSLPRGLHAAFLVDVHPANRIPFHKTSSARVLGRSRSSCYQALRGASPMIGSFYVLPLDSRGIILHRALPLTLSILNQAFPWKSDLSRSCLRLGASVPGLAADRRSGTISVRQTRCGVSY